MFLFSTWCRYSAVASSGNDEWSALSALISAADSIDDSISVTTATACR